MPDQFHAVPPSQNGWWKIIKSDGSVRGVETLAIVSPSLPQVEMWMKLIVDQANRGKK
jgi:hypothetical protein